MTSCRLQSNYGSIIDWLLNGHTWFLPRCMECRRGLAIWILSVRLSFCLSVCLSNACIVTKRKKDFSRFLYHTKDNLAYSFLRRMVGGGDPSTWNFWSSGLRWREIADFEPIIAHSASAVTLSAQKSSINTNRKSTMRFPMSLRWSAFVAPKPAPLLTGAEKAKRPLSV